MNREDTKEKLSAFADNELDEIEEHRLLSTLAGDAELRRTWERYHLARSALRQDLEIVIAQDAARKIAQKIDDEPSAAALRYRNKALRVVGTLALAASVAAIAIVGAQWLHAPAPAPVAARESTPQNIVHAGAMRWDTKHPETENALNVYLVEHNEFAPAAGLGMMPYVRVVSYDNDK